LYFSGSCIPINPKLSYIFPPQFLVVFNRFQCKKYRIFDEKSSYFVYILQQLSSMRRTHVGNPTYQFDFSRAMPTLNLRTGILGERDWVVDHVVHSKFNASSSLKEKIIAHRQVRRTRGTKTNHPVYSSVDQEISNCCAFSYPEPFLRAVNGARQGALAKSISNWHLIGYNEGYCSNNVYILLPCFYGIRFWIWPEPLVAPRVRRALGTRMIVA
jgi:hypothetical protein